VRREAERYGSADGVPANVVVAGATNVGKSTVLNAIATRGENFLGTTLQKKVSMPLTESMTPGTTLRSVHLDVVGISRLGPQRTQKSHALDRGQLTIVDTPGQILPTSIVRTAALQLADARALQPKRAVRPHSVRLETGKAILLGGLAVVEHTDGDPLVAKIFVAEGVVVHPIRSKRWPTFRQQHYGSLLRPPTRPSRDAGGQGGRWEGNDTGIGSVADAELADMTALVMGAAELTDADSNLAITVRGAAPAPKLSAKEFQYDSATMTTGSHRGDCMDISIAGLGWISLHGEGRARVAVHAPLGTLKVARSPPLLPFEKAPARPRPRHRTRPRPVGARALSRRRSRRA
jgi:hypothetical protein